MKQELEKLTRFHKSELKIISHKEISNMEIRKEFFIIQVSSLRLDCVVAEIAGISREKAKEIIIHENILQNFETETKQDKLLKIGDIVTIRGKGRFQIIEFLGKTKKENEKYKIGKWT